MTAPPRLGRTAATFVWLVAIIDAALILGLPLAVIVATIFGEPGGFDVERSVEIAVGLAIYVSTTLYGVVGAIVVTRQPGNTVGWLLWVAGIFWGLTIFGGSLGEAVEPGASAVADAIIWLAGPLLYVAIYLVLVFIPLWFPDGRLLTMRWRIAVWYAIAALGLNVARGLDLVPTWQGSFALADAIAVSSLGLGIASVAWRFRTGDRIKRQQIKWFSAAVLVAAAGFGLSFMFPESPGWAVGILGLALVPVAIGIAVLRYRLYEIDRIVSRTIGYAIVSLALAVVFVGVVVGLSAFLRRWTGDDTIAVAASTLVVAALFQPLRVRVQGVIDRRFNRSRYDADRTAGAFASRLRDQVDLVAVTDDLTATVQGALRPAVVSTWLRGSGE